MGRTARESNIRPETDTSAAPAGGSAGTPTPENPAFVTLPSTGRTYRVVGIERGETYDFAVAEVQFRDRWMPVRNVEMQIQIARKLGFTGSGR